MNKDNGGPASDRELLEMAARAAGIVGEYHEMGEGMRIEANPGHNWWNPLTDDGDALRLAVKLKIDFYIGEDDGEAIYAGYFTRGSTSQQFAIERNCGDSATRRAIVRAAAAIGSAM